MSKAKIDKEQVKHLADLAQLELTEEEIDKFSEQLSGILGYIDRIKDVELSKDVKRNFKNLNSFREDENPFESGEHREAILEEMPETENNMLVVKKILNK